jgi:peptide/nickel transport system permease protein
VTTINVPATASGASGGSAAAARGGPRAYLGRNPLLALLLKRAGLAVVTLFLVSVIVFVVAQVLPGNVGRSILGPYASNAQVAQLDRKLGLDRPIVIQYFSYIGGFIRGAWGTSYTLDVAVRPYVLVHLRNSLYLGALALIEIIPLSIGFGVLAAWKRNRWPDKVITITGLSLLALPEFVSGTILIVIFAVDLNWFPATAQVPSFNVISILHNLFLPSLPLLFVLFGYISRMARAGTVDALESNYVRTAYLKGLTHGAVLWRHALRNSLTPTITVIAVQLGYLIGGLVVTETLFSYPGIGNLIYTAAVDHDQPLLEAGVLLIAGIYTVANMLADLLYAVLNPRLRLGSRP